MSALYTILLLLASNIFMTLAWYGHLKLQSTGFFSQGSRFLSALFSSTGETVSDEDMDASVFQERGRGLRLR